MSTCSSTAQRKSLMQHHDAVNTVQRNFAMQLSFMWMLRHLLLGRETTVARKKDHRCPRPHHPQPDKKKGLQSCNWHLNSKLLLIGGRLKPQTIGSCTQQRDRQDQQVCSWLQQAQPFLSIPCDGCQWWDSTQHSAVCSQSPHPHRAKNFIPPNWAAPTAKAYWYQRLSVTLWTFNAYKVKPQSDIH